MAVKALQDILDRIETWPEERQERAAEILAFVERDAEAEWELTGEQVEEVRRRLADTSQPTLTLEEVFARRKW